MADDNLSKKVLVSFDADLDEAKASLADFVANANAAKETLKQTKQAIADAKVAQAQYNAEVAKSKVDQQAAKTAMDQFRLATMQANAAQKQAKQNVQAAAGSYDEAQKKLTALGRAIKSAEGGFNSMNPAIQKQIAEYNQLNNQLKKFDAQMGNHQRNVGNYGSMLDGLNSQLGSLIPGFSQFSGILKNATAGFNGMSAGAGEAEAGLGAMTGAELAAAGAAGALVAGIAVAVSYLEQYANWSDAFTAATKGMKAGWDAFLTSIGNADFKNMLKNISDAKDQAQIASGLLSDLQRQSMIAGTLNEKEDARVAELLLKMRDRATSAADAQNYFNEASSITGDQYKRNKKLVEDFYHATVLAATAGNGFSNDQIRDLNNLSQGYDSLLAKIKMYTDGAVNGAQLQKDGIKSLTEALSGLIGVQAKKDETEQRLQNRDDAKQIKGDQERIKAENDLIEAKRMGEQLVSERQDAIAKLLQDEMDAFGKELSMNDEHYRQLIFKQQDFIKKQEELRNKTKSSKAKAQYSKNIDSATSLIGNYREGNAADNERIITDYFKKTAEIIQKGQDEIAAIQISGIKNVTDRELAALKQQLSVETEAINREKDQIVTNIGRLENEIKSASGKRKDELQADLNQQLTILGNYDDKALALTQKFEYDRLRIIKEANDKETELNDNTEVLKAKLADKSGSNSADKALLEAEKQARLDKYTADVTQEGLTLAQKKNMYQQYLNDIAQLDDQYRIKQADKAIQWEQLVENTAFQIIQNSLNHQNQATEVALEKQKTHELNNQALTATQKAVIEERYRVQQGQLKVKEFKADQKLQISKALIDGAVAIQKTSAELGWPAALVGDAFIIAQTASQVAEIASQRPPAYAKGGLHYKSDGRGGVLPGYSRTDDTNAYLRSGEGVVVSEAMRDPWARNTVSAINVAYGGRDFSKPTVGKMPGFASGGVIGSYLPTPDNGLRLPSATIPGMITGADLNQITDAISNLQLLVDVKDINHQQAVKANVLDRVTH